MKKYRIIVSMIIALMLVCSAIAETSTYTGTSTGYHGPISVEVTLSDDAIEGVEITEQSETTGIGGRAIAILPERVVESQSVQFDAVTGATVTTAGFRAALKAALTEAGRLDEFDQPLPEAEHTEEHLTYDVVVAGSGVAGEASALSAAQAGASVLLLEKVSIIGGTTNASGGAVMGTMSYMNEERGDESIELADWWYARGEEKVNYDQLLFVTKQSGENVNWLIDLGWTPVLGTGGDSEKEWSHRPDDGTGNRLANGGSTVVNVLNNAFTELGGTTMVDTPLTELVTDESGAVIGCIAEGKNTTYHITANGGVILATGGFENDPEMKKAYAANKPDTGNLGANAGDTGDAIKLTIPLGADIVYPGYTMPAWNYPPSMSQYGFDVSAIRSEGRAIEINGRMERFVNELTTAEKEKWFMSQQEGSDFYILMDSQQEEAVLDGMEQASADGRLVRADSLAELAGLLGGDPETLKATVERWNELSAAGMDEDFGNDKITAFAIDGPYYACKVHEGNTGTYGGPRIDLDARVLKTDGTAIEGLYAAGECANGEFFYRDYICGGSSLAMGLAFGKTAGANAAARAEE